MNSETKQCQSCKGQFVIESEDFDFYKKIGGVVSPSLCPLCRAQRRLAFRNERTFYKSTCAKCKRDIISMYSSNKPYTVWCYECWFKDDWDAVDYAIPYDPQRSFMNQYAELLSKVPKVALIYVRSENSEYINIAAENKNCYMIIESSNNEGCVHGYWIQKCKDSIDTSFSHQTELSYESDDCYNCFKVFYSQSVEDCRESYFLKDCRNVSNSIGCVNLRNKRYCVFNQQLTKEEYEKFKEEAHLHTASGIEKLREDFNKFVLSQPLKYAEINNAVGSTGNYIHHAKNCTHSFHAYEAENAKYSIHVWRNAKDVMDSDTAGLGAELFYNTINTAIDSAHCICGNLGWTCTFMEYSTNCFNSNNIFGCVGLRKKDFAILNTVYSKEEYERLRAEIVEKMKADHQYGEFPDPQLSAFGYNESAAQIQFPLTREEASRQGFKWEDYPRGTFGKETLTWDTIPDSIRDLQIGDITKEIFVCNGCKRNYRIIDAELRFYKGLDIPLPRLCPECRHEKRFLSRGPNRTWERSCMCDYEKYKNQSIHPHHPGGVCPNTFETSYAPDRPEIVYCEACYNAEVI